MLSTLGIDAGAYRGSPGITEVIKTRTGSEIVSNESKVAASVSSAIDKMNEALSQLGEVRNDVLQIRPEMTTTIQGMIDSMKWALAALP